MTKPSTTKPGAHPLTPLFEPRGVIVAGASPHPGRFGTVVLHNLLRSKYQGRVFATSREGGDVLGVDTVRSVDELPDGAADLVIVCTPIAANGELLRACARKGVRAAFVASAGYSEAGAEGRQAEAELVALAEETGIILAGPNGQGVVSTPVSLCAQIVAPYPPRGSIAVASQSGNLTSSFMNYAIQTGAGISRAISVGNGAVLSTVDYLEYFADDAETSVCLAYLEGVADGGAFISRVRAVTQQKPLVLLKGGSSAGGQRAASSHTGSLATNQRVFAAACRQAGVARVETAEEGFYSAATFATQPLPAGPNTVVITTAGGWGVLTADAIAGTDLRLLPLPDDLHASADALLPARWSHNNPIDTAAGETRDTVPALLELAAQHESVDAVIFLGSGIQSNQAQMMKSGPYFPNYGLDRIVAFHERQDRRYAEAAASISATTGKPILVVTELAVTAPNNPGPRAVRESGRVAYPSAQIAVRALDHLWRYARYR
ncbi:MAG: CoA-binding protein, partial [Dehalococcoidia bacterium]